MQKVSDSEPSSADMVSPFLRSTSSCSLIQEVLQKLSDCDVHTSAKGKTQIEMVSSLFSPSCEMTAKGFVY